MSPLAKFKILIADSDQQLAQISKQMLRGMGFSNIELISSASKALYLTKADGFDFVITEWTLRDHDGIWLINHIRRDPDSPSPTLPVIMLTGRMEASDVQYARDHGIHEYVVKPFSARTIFDRLERIIDFPRYFIKDSRYIGPDRRHKQVAISHPERRQNVILPQRKPWDAAKQINEAAAGPQIWLPDSSLKHKLGRNVSLQSIITPAILSQAQQSIDAMSDESLQWVKKDLNDLTALYHDMVHGNHTAALLNEMVEVTLMISSRSGTFGYLRASEVAYMLYIFMRNKLNPSNPNHYAVIEKHIEVLQLIFGKNIRKEEGDILLIIEGLKTLTERRLAFGAG